MRYLNQPFFPLLLAVFPIVSLDAHNQQHFLFGVVVLLCIAVFYCFLRNGKAISDMDSQANHPKQPLFGLTLRLRNHLILQTLA